MDAGEEPDRPPGDAARKVLRPAAWQPRDRHIILGVSHPTDDPSRHRVFEVRAVFDAARGGWAALAGEQDLNEQRGDWDPVLTERDQASSFPTAAACLGHATAAIIAAVDREAEDAR
jgi:hypothetical protein